MSVSDTHSSAYPSHGYRLPFFVCYAKNHVLKFFHIFLQNKKRIHLPNRLFARYILSFFIIQTILPIPHYNPRIRFISSGISCSKYSISFVIGCGNSSFHECRGCLSMTVKFSLYNTSAGRGCPMALICRRI